MSPALLGVVLAVFTALLLVVGWQLSVGFVCLVVLCKLVWP